jgi:hypothetical protein
MRGALIGVPEVAGSLACTVEVGQERALRTPQLSIRAATSSGYCAPISHGECTYRGWCWTAGGYRGVGRPARTKTLE